MINREDLPYQWKIGAEVERFNFDGDSTGHFIITDLTPRCVILNDHSKWCRAGMRIGQTWDGGYYGRIEMVLDEAQTERAKLLSIINKIEWNTLDTKTLRAMVRAYETGREDDNGTHD